jgi:hypothetical protein
MSGITSFLSPSHAVKQMMVAVMRKKSLIFIPDISESTFVKVVNSMLQAAIA